MARSAEAAYSQHEGPSTPRWNGRRFSSHETALFAVFAAGVVLRVLLASVNTDANDPHLPVISVIAFENRFPESMELWQAYQPKLYHTTVALIWKLWPTAEPATLNRIAQLVNAAAGIITLVVVLRFLKELTLSPRVRLVVFALVALNPRLIAINGQATNDTFVILFASLVLYFGYHFFHDGSRRAFIGMVAAACLAGLSKGNGLVAIIAVLATFVAAVLRRPGGAGLSRRRLAVHAALFLAIAGPIVWEIGPYGYHHRAYGSPLVTNWAPSPPPHLFRRTWVERPGVTSLAHGLLTFRFISLMREPISTDDRQTYPAHRTSVWTRLHALSHFVHFEQAPPAWKNADPRVQNLGRVLLLLGLLPTLLLVAGLLVGVVQACRWVLQGPARSTLSAGALLLVIAACGYIAFVVFYSVRLRDYSSIKAIFVFPGLLGFVILFSAMLERFLAWCRRIPYLEQCALLLIALLTIGYVVDMLVLITSLA